MKCKVCGEEMKLGYIQCRDGVFWRTKLQRIAAVPSEGKNSIKLSGQTNGPFSGSFVEAYNCEKCRTVIIDYK